MVGDKLQWEMMCLRSGGHHSAISLFPTNTSRENGAVSGYATFPSVAKPRIADSADGRLSLVRFCSSVVLVRARSLRIRTSDKHRTFFDEAL